MKDIIKCCDKKIAETILAIQNIEAKLKTLMESEEFSEIIKMIKENEQATKHLLRQKNSTNLST